MLALLQASETYRTSPAADQLEVTTIGPGFGECILIHVGDGKWIVIDSCVGQDDPNPVALRYLNDIGVSFDQVVLIVVSHWDDDHSRGIAKLVGACVNARVAMSHAFIEKDFLAFVSAYSSPLTTSVRSGVKEIKETLEIMRQSGRTTILRTSESRRL